MSYVDENEGVAFKLFNEFRNGGLKRIQQSVQDREAESLYLDFKETASSSGSLTDDDRRNLGKNLSGFANANGGVLVWGVMSKSFNDRNPVSEAVDLKPIPKIVKFVEGLNSEIGRVVERPVLGADVFLIADDLTDADGYAVVYVPPSIDKPHMCIAKGEMRYYMRSGSQTLRIGHALVETLFRVNELPKLELNVRDYKIENHYQRGRIIRVYLELRNTGNVIAERVAISLLSSRNRNYGGTTDFRDQSIVHIAFDENQPQHAMQYRMIPNAISFPGMTMHGIEVIQTLKDNPEEMIVKWRIDADRFRSSGIIDLAQYITEEQT